MRFILIIFIMLYFKTMQSEIRDFIITNRNVSLGLSLGNNLEILSVSKISHLYQLIFPGDYIFGINGHEFLENERNLKHFVSALNNLKDSYTLNINVSSSTSRKLDSVSLNKYTSLNIRQATEMILNFQTTISLDSVNLLSYLSCKYNNLVISSPIHACGQITSSFKNLKNSYVILIILIFI